MAAGILGGAFVQLYRAYSASFMRKMLHSLTSTQRKWTRRFGRIGFAARGVVFGIIAICLVIAAWSANPQQAVGLDGALQRLARQPCGAVLLGVVAFGLVLYGLFMLLCTKYRRVTEP